MYVELNNNVYIVEGEKFDCIYELNTKKLFRVNKTVTKLIKEIISDREYMVEYMQGNIQNFIKELCKYRILVPDGKREPLIRAKKNHGIKMAWIEITQKCNFRCVHCYEGEKLFKSMTKNEVLQIIDKLVMAGVEKLQIIGGEPMLHPDIEDILKYCEGQFKNVSVFTNASFITKGLCEVLKKIEADVFVSLHSDLDEEFDRVTGTFGMLPKVQKNIELMKNLGINPKIKKVKINGIKSSLEYESFFEKIHGFPILVGNASLEQYDEQMITEKIITEKKFRKLLDVDAVLENMEYQSCFSKKVYIDVNQNVYPCILERRKIHGNLKNNTLNEVVQESICRTTKDSIDECKKCEYRFACDTCFPDTRSDDFYAKPWYCSYDPMNGKWISVDSLKKYL